MHFELPELPWKDPESQGSQVWLPVLDAKKPGPHFEQAAASVAPSDACSVPTGQCLQSPDPWLSAYCPCVQAVHASLLAMPVPELEVPFGHLPQDVAP